MYHTQQLAVVGVGESMVCEILSLFYGKELDEMKLHFRVPPFIDVIMLSVQTDVQCSSSVIKHVLYNASVLITVQHCWSPSEFLVKVTRNSTTARHLEPDGGRKVGRGELHLSSLFMVSPLFPETLTWM